LAAINNLQGNPFPRSDIEAEIFNEVNRLAKMRSLADRAVLMRRQRKQLVKQLQRQVSSHDQEDGLAQTQITTGESAIAASTHRLQVLNEALAEATELTLGYQRILDVVSRTPPFLESHLAQVEANLTLARQQLQDMTMYRKNMYIQVANKSSQVNDVNAILQAEKMNSVKTQQLQQKLEYYGHARRKVAQKRRDYCAKNGILDPGGLPTENISGNRGSSPGDDSCGGPPAKKHDKKFRKDAGISVSADQTTGSSAATSSNTRMNARDRHAARSRSRKMTSMESATISSSTQMPNFAAGGPDSSIVGAGSSDRASSPDAGRPNARITRRKVVGVGGAQPRNLSPVNSKSASAVSAHKSGRHGNGQAFSALADGPAKDALPAIMHSLVDAFKKASTEVYLSGENRSTIHTRTETEADGTEEEESDDADDRR
jgi:hypothetical protein